MKKLQLSGLIARGFAAGVAIISLGTVAQAAPYATSLANSGTAISFRLNESADSVKIISSAGTLDLGPRPAGVTTTNVTITGVYSVEVSKAGTGTFTQISTDSNALRFVNPRGVAVNRNPASPYFGRVYLGNSSSGATSAANGSRTTGQGIYVFNPDLTDAVGQGATPRTGGLILTASSASVPWRVTVGENDDNVYFCDWSDASGNLYRTDPNVATNSVATNVLCAMPTGKAVFPVGVNLNHGSISAAVVTGSMANGDLTVWTVDEDLQPDRTASAATERNSLWRYDIGVNTNALPYVDFQANQVARASIRDVSQTMGLARGANGYFYFLNNRVDGNEAVVKVLDSGNNSAGLLFDTRTGSLALGYSKDICSNGVAVAVSSDQKYMAVARNNGSVLVVPLENGIPDLYNSSGFTAFSVGTVRDIAFDAANNLYVISSSTAAGGQLLRVFSLGLTTTTTTTSDGTFNLVKPTTQVYTALDNDLISEEGTTSATYSFIRANDDLGQDLTVVFKMSGTATNGLDYVLKTNGVALTTNAVVIPAGLDRVDVTITAVDDSVSELVETAILTLNGTGAYTPIQPSVQTVAILDNDAQVLAISGVLAPNMYKGHTNDFASFRITRYGDTNAPTYTVSNFTYAGTGVFGIDHAGVSPITVEPGAVTVVGRVSPLQVNTGYVGNKTVVVTLAAGAGYTVGTNSTNATLTSIDNANPAAPVLYANPLTDPNDAANWNVTYANANMAGHPLDDYEVVFGYDLTANNPASVANGVIPLPPNGATTALRITANKKYLGATAGVNIYPTNVTFSGDYAVRFNMNLVQPSNGGQTEGVLFGVNHNGRQTNWWSGDALITPGTWASDGIWYWIDASPGGAVAGDYLEFTGLTGKLPNAGWQYIQKDVFGATSFPNAFKSPAPYTISASGLPANASPLLGTDAGAWSDVEIKQVKNVITMSINKTTIFNYTNTTSFTNGTLMLGFGDPFKSLGSPDGAAYFSNLRVVRLAGPSISSINWNGSTVTMVFTSIDGTDSAASFALQSSGANGVAGPYADVAGATITQLPSGAFQVVATSANQTQFFRIRHK